MSPSKDRLPCLFLGHGSPMIALEDNQLTKNFADLGIDLKKAYNIKGIISISAHWYRTKNRVQDQEDPQQIYDFRGFPPELSNLVYEPRGSHEMSQAILDTFGDDILTDNSWGIDHGTWTVLKHIFPEADIPVVQINVNMTYSLSEIFDFGKKLESLRDKYLIVGSGNIVHNLWKVDWANPGGTEETESFDTHIHDLIMKGDYQQVTRTQNHPNFAYAVPQNDHFAPLIYILGAAGSSGARSFNRVCQLGSVSMTSYIFTDQEE